MSVYVQDSDLTIHVGDVREVLPTLPDGSVDCCVTSPPYWGLRDYGADGQVGLEASPDAYVAEMVAVFREVRRVLSEHGTLWLNLGDSYSHGGNGSRDPVRWPKQSRNDHRVEHAKATNDTKPKDLVGIPWRVAFALQADGWWLRSDIIWSKPNPMPESVTDRPTKAHEYVFLLTKSPRYFYDSEAIAEPAAWERWGDQTVGGGSNPGGWIKPKSKQELVGKRTYDGFNGRWDAAVANGTASKTRNARSVWEIATQPYPDAHFATFPEELPRRCILAGCPEWVCGTCGKARERLVEREASAWNPAAGAAQVAATGGAISGGTERSTLGGFTKFVSREQNGWSDCGHDNYRPGVVLDPFLGSGTTALVARKHGRRCVGIELNSEYTRLAAKRCQQLSLLAG